MKHARQIIWALCLLAVSGVCASCGESAGVSTAGLTDKQKADAAAAQQGKGGGKAKNGGGVMPEPDMPKPGEHVGAPPTGGKAGGG